MAVQEMTIDRAIDNAIASTEMEGFTITDKMKSLMKQILLGEISMEDAIRVIEESDD